MNRDKFTDVIGIKFVLELAIVSKKKSDFCESVQAQNKK